MGLTVRFSQHKNKQMGWRWGQYWLAHALRWMGEEQREALQKVLTISLVSIWQCEVQMASGHSKSALSSEERQRDWYD